MAIVVGNPSPYELSNNAAVYSLAGSASDLTWLIDGSNRLYYVADRSGNSSVNGLVLPGVASNYASAPDSAAVSITGDLDARAWVAPNSVTPAADETLISKYTTAGNQRSWMLRRPSGSDSLRFNISADGTANTQVDSSTTVGFTSYTPLWVRVTWRASDGRVQFFKSTDGDTWTQVGTDGTAAVGAIFDSTAVIGIGAYDINGTGANLFPGVIRRAQIYNGIAGTLAFDANFTTAAKLATSFTESSSNAATVTINQSAIALPARIHGARDLYQGLTASMPTFSVSGGYNIATFDGTADYLKSAPFSLSQPESVYFTGSAVSWTLNDSLYDGGGTNTLRLYQEGTTPALRIRGGADGPGNSSLALGVMAVITGIFNGASSRYSVNNGTAATGTVGTGDGAGFTLGARGDAGTPSNMTWSQSLIRSVADDTALSSRIIRYFMRLGGIAG